MGLLLGFLFVNISVDIEMTHSIVNVTSFVLHELFATLHSGKVGDDCGCIGLLHGPGVIQHIWQVPAKNGWEWSSARVVSCGWRLQNTRMSQLCWELLVILWLRSLWCWDSFLVYFTWIEHAGPPAIWGAICQSCFHRERHNDICWLNDRLSALNVYSERIYIKFRTILCSLQNF